MVKCCCISKCNSESYSGCGISFHRFPKSENMRKMWLEVLPLSQKITKNSVVCGLHFKHEDFHFDRLPPTLKFGSVPSVFDHTEDNLQNKQSIQLNMESPSLEANSIAVLSHTQQQQTSPSPTCSRPTSPNATIPSTTGPMPTCPNMKEVAVQTIDDADTVLNEKLRHKIQLLSKKLKKREIRIKKQRSALRLLKDAIIIIPHEV